MQDPRAPSRPPATTWPARHQDLLTVAPTRCPCASRTALRDRISELHARRVPDGLQRPERERVHDAIGLSWNPRAQDGAELELE